MAQTEQHTRGPWKATERSGYHEILGPRVGATWYGEPNVWAVAYADTDRDEGEQVANARLIAAAPDLLKVAELALDFILYRQGNDAGETVTVADLRSAIASATGSSS